MAKSTFLNRAQKVAVSTTDEVLELPGIPSNKQVCYDRITALNESHDVTSVQIGLKDGASEYILDGKLAPGSNCPFSVQGKIFAPGNLRPFVRYVGATAGDKVSLTAYGYISDMTD